MKPLFALALLCYASPVTPAQAGPDAANPLPVRKVTLFTSGVAFTQRIGEVDGDATVPLTFRTAQINDILKSMMLVDQRGQVRPAVYAARDPIGRSLQSFAVDVTQNLTLVELLTRMRGARVTVDTTNKGALTGQIVGVEQRQVAGDDGKPVTAPFLTVLGDNGVTSVRLDAEKSVRILDDRLNKEFREALGLLASGSDEQRRQVTLHFAGDGKRQVFVGYVTEAPLWKMTYRLMVDGLGGDGKPYLQGWALVENTTDDDWKDVQLSLVSGRPVSFIQDLYQPLYIPRPIVGPDVVASPTPQTHAGDILERKEVAENKPAAGVALGGMGGGMGGASYGRSAGARGAAGEKGVAGPAGDKRLLGYDVDNSIITDFMRESVKAEAAGQVAGELFEYNITTPVSLPRQQAAMIPVITKEIEAHKVSIYNADTNSKFPLNAVRIVNTTGLHLKAGPVTLFDGGAYAGDARMEEVPKGDSRLISYAVDLSIEGERKASASPSTEISVRIRRGVLISTRREQQETTYTLKSKADKARTVLVEHPYDAEWKLVTPVKAEERTSDLYRFAVPLAAGKTQTLKVVTERPVSQEIMIVDADLNVVAYYANKKDVSAKLRETLQDVVQRRRKVQELQAQAAAKDAEIAAMATDQERIRKNMEALDKTSPLYKRYVSELDAQETKLQTLRRDTAKLRSDADDANRALRGFVDALTIEG